MRKKKTTTSKSKTMTIEEEKKASIEDLYKKYSSNEKGLSSQEAKIRLEKFGPNEITEEKANPWLKFLGYFWGSIAWMIEAAAIISAIIQHWDDFIVILAMLMTNAIVGFWQERKADNAIELLKKKLALQAKALRDGEWVTIAARELVVGDIVRVRLGDIIPADMKLIEGDYLSIDESVLTGESLPVTKKISAIGFEGSIVRKGEMNGLVIATGDSTFFGRTTQLMGKAKTKSHFQKAVTKIGNFLIILAFTLVIITFIVKIVRGEDVLIILQFALILLVAAIPVAMPAVLTVSLAVGAQNLAKKEAIARKLVAIEEAAGMDILCSDKTGTITQNEITIAKSVPYNNITEKDLILYGVLASRKEDKDPIDDAFFEKYNEIAKEPPNNFQLLKFQPFDPVVKRTEASIKNNDGTEFKVAKGAVQVIIGLTDQKEELGTQIENESNNFAAKGYRVLGVAKTNENNIWKWLGMVALSDPPRPDSAETIKKAEEMGIKVQMVTGDHAAIAKEIARSLGMGTNILAASDILEKRDDEAKDLIDKADGFAQVYPEHKYHIVELLQADGHIVGMTGDGVNDAPALKKADVGFAVSNATDAAKSAAAVVLTKPGLSVIIDSIFQSREIFQRMKFYAVYRIAETLRVLIFLVLMILVYNIYPITAIMLVILALLNDLPIMTIAFDNQVPSPYPERWNMKRVVSLATVLGLSGVLFSVILFWISITYIFPVPIPIPTLPSIAISQMTSAQQIVANHLLGIQTLLFLNLAVRGHMTIYLTRTDKDHFWRRPFPSKILFFTCEGTQIVATFFAAWGFLMHPIGIWVLFLWGYALATFAINDWVKVVSVKILDHFENHPLNLMERIEDGLIKEFKTFKH